MLAGPAVKTGKSPSHIMSPVKPEDIEAAGELLTDIVKTELSAVQLFELVTATLIWSPLTKSVRVTTLDALAGPKLMLFLKN